MVYLGITLLLIVIVITAIVLIVHIGFRAPRRIEHNSPADYGLAYEEIHIRTTAGKQLFAWWLPALQQWLVQQSGRLRLLLVGY